MIRIISQGNENSLYNESSGEVNVDFNDSAEVNNNTENISHFDSFGNSKKIRFNFDKLKSSVDTNCEFVTEEKYQEIYQEIGKLKPFYDSMKRKFVKVKNKVTKIKLGVNTDFRLKDNFVERNILTTRKYAGFENLDDMIDYPFSFNYDNFFTLTNRLDVFSNISKIQMKESYIDSLKGFKSNSLGNSNSAFGEKLKIKNYFYKKSDSVYHYEDDIISSFLYADRDKFVVDKIIKNINNTTGVQSNTVVTKKKNIISGDVRYFAFKENKTLPFYDRSVGLNHWNISNKKNRYVFTDTNINNKILENRSEEKTINESILYSSRGRDCDYSFSNGIDSLIFNGRID